MCGRDRQVANAAAAAIALESGSAAKIRWKLATARIVNLLGNRNKISLAGMLGYSCVSTSFRVRQSALPYLQPWHSSDGQVALV